MSVIEQKCWKYIQEVNNAKPKISGLVALEDCKRKYTYRQMYGMWDICCRE